MSRTSPSWSNSTLAVLAASLLLMGGLARSGAQDQNQAEPGTSSVPVAPNPAPRLPKNKLPTKNAGSGTTSSPTTSAATSSSAKPGMSSRSTPGAGRIPGLPRNKIEPRPPAPTTSKGGQAKRVLPTNALPRSTNTVNAGEVLNRRNPFIGEVRPGPPRPHRGHRDPHAGWFHGNWNGDFGSNHRWDWTGLATKAEAAGLTGWKVGSAVYLWGYSPYHNPYALTGKPTDPTNPSPAAVGFDYTQPLAVERPLPAPNVLDPVIEVLDDARAAFRTGDYSKALVLSDQVLKTLPGDVAIHELRALALFALKRYDEAAATLHAVLSMGPGWDWTTQIGLYSQAEPYTEQLRALEDHRDAHPDDASDHFVLAYHYLTAGHTDVAAEELRDVARLKPNDRLAGHLLALIAPRTPDKKNEDREPRPDRGPTLPPAPDPEPMKPQRSIASNTNPETKMSAKTSAIPEKEKPSSPSSEPKPAPKPELEPRKPQSVLASIAKVPEMKKEKPRSEPPPSVANTPETKPKTKPRPPAIGEFAGSWKASPGKGMTIDLAIRPDKTFSWTVTGGQASGRPRVGAFSYAGETLALVQENGTPLVGWLVWQDEDHFRFRIAGVSAYQSGLEFSR